VRAAVLLDAGGAPVAYSVDDDVIGADLGDLAAQLVSHAGSAAARDGDTVAQIEVSTAAGMVFSVTERPPGASAPWTLAVVAKRFSLASLMFMDLRHILGELGPVPA
jgi:hypothetical protein